jgi:hypothetical protein
MGFEVKNPGLNPGAVTLETKSFPEGRKVKILLPPLVILRIK